MRRPAPKICLRCRRSRTPRRARAPFLCRACRAPCCEHLCGFKHGRSATCGACQDRTRTVPTLARGASIGGGVGPVSGSAGDGGVLSPARGSSPAGERVYLSLRRHLGRSGGFTLVLLFPADPRAADEVRRRLAGEPATTRPGDAGDPDDAGLDVVAVDASSGPVDGGASAGWATRLEEALAPDEGRVRARSPVWLALDDRPGDPAADRRRDAVLAALNQHRTQLERSFRRPLLISLPPSYLPRTWEVAPDLWSVRGTVVELPAPATPETPADPSDPRLVHPTAHARR